MLAAFSMENFGSFRDEYSLDLRRADRSPAGAGPWDGSLETVAAIYGANASGKSTLFRGLFTLRALVESSYRAGRVDVEPFALDADFAKRPTRLSATFVADDNVCYAYGVEILAGRVVQEWAERFTTQRATLLFERTGDQFNFGAALVGPKKSVQNTVSSSTLFLSAAAAARYEPLMPLYRWFAENLRCYSAGGYQGIFQQVYDELEKDEQAKNRVAAMLRDADLGLADLELVRRPLTEGELATLRHQQSLLRTLEGRDIPLPADIVEARLLHRSDSGMTTLAFEQESDGTRAMLGHAFVLDQALTFGRTVVFDEIDASLHPLMVANIVSTFKDRDLNPRQAQLIFTTHDVSLIEPNTPRGAAITSDEMWVTQKDHTGASQLIAIAEYRPRRADNLGRRYLHGRYGGIPENIDLAAVAGSGR